MNCMLQTFSAHTAYMATVSAADAKGLGIQPGVDVATMVAAADIRNTLGLQLVSRAAKDVEKVTRKDSMTDKLELPQPRKVSLEALSQVGTPVLRQPLSQSTDSTVIIFDWDDTLLCTSWLCQHMDFAPSGDLYAHLRKIAQQSQSMLEAALKMGHTYVITNSMSGWVEHSAGLWVPELLPVLRQVQIISARDTYEHLYPDDAGQWKLQAFLEIRHQFAATPIENLVVLGDEDFEMRAAQAMENDLPSAFIKTVKFQAKPSAKEHLRQLELVAEKFDRIVRKRRSLQVYLERKGAVTRQ